MKYYLIFGPPGAGKGTQSKLMADKFKFRHVSTGELLRKEILNQSEIGIKAAVLIDKGEYVPDDMVIDIIKKEIADHPDVKGFIFDGFPRTLTQAQKLDDLLKESGHEVTSVLALKIDDKHVMHRIHHRALEENRLDDSDINVIEKRITTYHQKTEPIMTYYTEQGKIREIDGSGSVDEIFDIISSHIE